MNKHIYSKNDDKIYLARQLDGNADVISVLNCGALAPEWRFWEVKWRLNFFGAPFKKPFKNREF